MKPVVVYESMFGATRVIAEAIACGFTEYDETTVVRASEVGGSVLYDADLCRRGRTDARAEHVEAQHTERRTGLCQKAWRRPRTRTGRCRRAWRAGVDRSSRAAHHVRCCLRHHVKGPAALTGRASKAINRGLASHGMSVVAPPESFLVDKNGSFLPGEVARAAAWGATLARAVRARRGAAV